MAVLITAMILNARKRSSQGRSIFFSTSQSEFFLFLISLLCAGLTANSYHDPTGAGVIRDRRPRREGNDRRTRRQIRLQLLRPWRRGMYVSEKHKRGKEKEENKGQRSSAAR